MNSGIAAIQVAMVKVPGCARLYLVCFIFVTVLVRSTSEKRPFVSLLKLGMSLPPMKRFFRSLMENGTLQETLESLPFAGQLIQGALPFMVGDTITLT